MNLISALTEGTVEYRDNGIVIRHPPNSLMLHASRELKKMLEICQTNNIAIQSLQNQNQQLLQDLQNANDRLEAIRNVPADQNQGVREGEGQTQEQIEAINVGGGGV